MGGGGAVQAGAEGEGEGCETGVKLVEGGECSGKGEGGRGGRGEGVHGTTHPDPLNSPCITLKPPPPKKKETEATVRYALR